LTKTLSMHNRKIAIYGGSFNPIHLGHMALADSICKTGIIDEVWFMVSPLNPLKQNDTNTILPTEQRLILTRLALKEYPKLKASDFETRLPVPSYTIKTLTELHNTYPNYDFKLIVGQDNWINFDRWVEAKKIKQNHDIIVYARKSDYDTAVDNNDEAQVVIYKKDGKSESLKDYNFKLFNISSTQIRQAFKERNLPFAAKWLEPDVMRYILENQLYK